MGEGGSVAPQGSGKTPLVLQHLQSLLAASVERHGVPSASIAVRFGDRTFQAAAGWANRSAGIEATPGAVYHFGSTTKMLTATLVARLVDQGLIELDAPIARYIPDFTPPDPAVAQQLTVRHCLTHQAGLIGIIFAETGSNDDTVARQVGLLNGAPQYHTPGAVLSYCNSGLILLGRLIECTLRKPWAAAIVQDLAQPLGMHSVASRPEQALRQRYAVGQVPDPGTGQWAPDPHPYWMPGHGPAGSTCAGSPSDLLSFCTMHLQDGVAVDGTRYLSPQTARLMQELQVPSPTRFLYAGFGLGWVLYDWGGRRILGHDGSTAGSNSFLRVDPQNRVAVSLLVNCRAGLPVYEDLFSEIFRELSGAWEPDAPPVMEGASQDLDRYAGTYADCAIRLTVERSGQGMTMSVEPTVSTPLSKTLAQRLHLRPWAPGQFYVSGPDAMLGVRDAPLTTRLVRPYAVIEAEGRKWLHNGTSAFRGA